jgi:hypothetical protein
LARSQLPSNPDVRVVCARCLGKCCMGLAFAKFFGIVPPLLSMLLTVVALACVSHVVCLCLQAKLDDELRYSKHKPERSEREGPARSNPSAEDMTGFEPVRNPRSRAAPAAAAGEAAPAASGGSKQQEGSSPAPAAAAAAAGGGGGAWGRGGGGFRDRERDGGRGSGGGFGGGFREGGRDGGREGGREGGRDAGRGPPPPKERRAGAGGGW